MTKIAIIVLNYNGKNDTKELLQSLDKVEKKDFNLEIILIDNGSKDASFDVSRYQNKINLIKNKKNIGFAAANNQGIKLALENGADYFCLLNNDTIVKEDFIEKAIRELLIPEIKTAAA